MSIIKKNLLRMSRKKRRVRHALKKTNSGRFRVSVFRSLNHIYAQIIDDVQQHTIASCSSLELKQLTGSKKEVAFEIGKELAKRILNIEGEYSNKVVFDRGQYEYHGRIAEVAAGLREGGLNF